jgi:hypothetical protein
MFGDDALADFGEKLDVPEGWSEKLFENLLVYVKGRYRPCISTVQALVIAQNHRASLDEKVTSAWLLNSAVSWTSLLFYSLACEKEIYNKLITIIFIII